MATRTATSTTSVVVDIDTTGEAQFKRAALTGDVTAPANSNTTTIPDGTVTNAKAATMAADTVKVNNTGSTATATNLTMATSTVLGRGPTGHIDDLAVDSSLAITDTGLGRAALTGAITAAAGSNTTALAADAVTTAAILDANVTTAKIALNAVGNARLAKGAANTLKGNATGSTADLVDLTLLGGLSMDGTSKVKSKSSIALNFLFDTQTTLTDPGSTKCNFNSDKTKLIISDASLGGRDVSPLVSIINNGTIHFMANDATGSAWVQFRVTAATTDGTGLFHTLDGACVAGLDTVPADGAEIVLYYVGIDNAADVDAINKELLYIRRNALNQLINELDQVISGTPVVANQAALPDVEDYDGFTYRVDNQGLYGIDYQANVDWSPTNGTALIDLWTQPDATKVSYIWPASTFNGAYTCSNVGGKLHISCTGTDYHGLTEAVAIGQYVVVKTGTGVAAGQHKVTGLDSDTTGLVIETDTNYSGTPTITAMAIATSGGAAGSQFTVRTITIPALRANSCIELILNVISDTLAGTVGRHTIIKLGTDTLYDQNYSSVSNDYIPLRFLICNTGSTALQRCPAMSNSTGYVSSGTSQFTPLGTTETNVATTLTIVAGCDTANVPVEYVHGQCYIRG